MWLLNDKPAAVSGVRSSSVVGTLVVGSVGYIVSGDGFDETVGNIVSGVGAEVVGPLVGAVVGG